MKIYKTIDLFAGVGGIRLGFEQTKRFKTIFANDFDKFCKITYDLNFKTTKLNTVDIKLLAKKNGLDEFDVLLAGFPCQAFSIAGYRKGFEDKERGTLFFDMYKIIKKYQPKAILLENVKNLITHDNGNTYKVIKQSLEVLDYKIYEKVLNSMEYANVSQNRERIYIVGFRPDIKNRDKFNFPSKKKLTKKVKDYFEKSDVDIKYYYNDRFSMYQKLKEKIINHNIVYQWRRIYVRENKSGVCPTLTANMGTGGHNVPLILNRKGIRKLTPRECFNLQGFPKKFKLPPIANAQLYKQAGNSVVVPMIKLVAEQMLEILDKK